jgi:hypothetical protein
MARATRTTYTAADRYERRATRRQRPTVRRQSTRVAVLAAALAEVSA